MPVKKTRCGNTWTEAKYFGFIRSALRRASIKYPVKYQIKALAKRSVPIIDKDGNQAVYKTGKNVGQPRYVSEYNCAFCKEWFRDKDVEVDHKDEAGSLKCFDDLPGFCERLFCEIDNLQVLCKTCHKGKTHK